MRLVTEGAGLFAVAWLLLPHDERKSGVVATKNANPMLASFVNLIITSINNLELRFARNNLCGIPRGH